MTTLAFAYTPHVGDRAAPLAGPGLDGSVVELESFRGKWVWLEFWATSCGPCLRQLPDVLETTRQLRAQGRLEIVLVSLDAKSDEQAARQWIKANAPDCPVMLAGGTPIIVGPQPAAAYSESVAAQAMQWSIRNLPANYLISPEGVVYARQVDVGQLEQLLRLVIDSDSYSAYLLGCRSSVVDGPDGYARLVVDLWSPSRSPLATAVSCKLIEAELIEYGGFVIPVRRKFHPSETCGSFAQVVDFTGGTHRQLELPLKELSEFVGVQYKVEVTLPGTALPGNEPGIQTIQIGTYYPEFPTYSYEF